MGTMQRTKPPAHSKKTDRVRVPDAINCTVSYNFTQVPNNMLRDPNLSAKAKGILCLLLSNREGWTSYVAGICSMMANGPKSIYSGLTELEQQGYLMRLKYRNKATKYFAGVLWCYTDTPGQFELERAETLLEQNGLELEGVVPDSGKPVSPKPESRFSEYRKPPTNNTKVNNTKGNNMQHRGGLENSGNGGNGVTEPFSPTREQPITASMFPDFWQLYPKKDGKGKAKTKWEQVCTKPPQERPTWGQIKSAIIAQKDTPRWQEDCQFIPLATTWLNQQRWLDDPKLMTVPSYNKGNNGRSNPSTRATPQQGSSTGTSGRALIKERFGPLELQGAFEQNCYKPAKLLLTVPDGKAGKLQLAEILLQFHDDIQRIQRKHMTGEEIARSMLPGPIQIIAEYLDWIARNSWIHHTGLSLLDVGNSLFQRFRRDEANKDNMQRDALTGKSYIRD